MNTTRALAGFAAGLKYADLPASTVDWAKRLFLDGLGCLVVGTRGGPGQSAAATVRRFGGAPQATVYTGAFKASPRDAAFANGIALYSVGLNDNYKPGVAHPGAVVVPVLLAVGEWQDVAGEDLIAAMVAGYDVNGRIARSIAPSHRERGFHPTGTCGTFAATAAAGRMLGLEGEQMASAFGLNGSQAAGLYEFHHDGSLTMIFHAGRAAQNGIEAVLLTLDGVTGPATVIEGSKGFCRATANAFDEASITDNLGSEFLIEATSFRPYYGCSSTASPSAAVEEILRQSGARGDDVARIDVRCHPVVMTDNNDPNPTTLLAARLSLQYNVALVLDRDTVLIADLTDQDLWNPAIRDRMALVHMQADPAVPRFGVMMTATLNDGRRIESNIASPRGDPDMTLDWNAVVEKFRQMTEPVIGEAAIERAIEIVHDLERARMAELAEVLTGATAPVEA